MTHLHCADPIPLTRPEFVKSQPDSSSGGRSDSPFFWGFLLLVLLLTGTSCGEKSAPLHLPPYNIGYIPFSEKLDNPTFEFCDERVIIENGSRQASYRGGAKAVLQYFEPVKKEMPALKGETGYLTVRFVMNCRGEKDRYRLLGISKKYKPKEFSPAVTDRILRAVREMDGWQIAVYSGQVYDSYNMLTFKLEDGQITDIIL